MGPDRPRVPAEGAVVLSHHRFELAAMLAAGVAVRPVHAAAVPGQPSSGIGVEVFAVAEIEQLALERSLRRRIRVRSADLASEHDRDRHPITVPRRPRAAYRSISADNRW